MRSYDIVVFGATGFTGRLLCAHLATHAPEGIVWAMAGRSRDKLARVRAEIAQAAPKAADVPLVEADSGNVASLEALAASARVVVSTVGPYMAQGLDLVRACAAAGTHYADLTGETPFVRDSIDAVHDLAKSTGARIVHCCGYDSIPSDLGAFLAQSAMVARGGPAQRVTTVVGPTRGGVSGGTAASMLGVVAAGRADRDVARTIAHSFALDPRDDQPRRRIPDQASAVYRPAIAQWTAPFFMAIINTRVVRRSHALLGRPWGDDFVYDETMATGQGLRGRATAIGITAALGAFLGAAAWTPTRGLLARLLPAAGEGPDAEAREAGFFRHLVLAETDDPAHRLAVRVHGTADPGYGETAKMLGEAACCLAVDTADLPDRAGVLTPSTAMGLSLVERLRSAGMVWRVEDWPEGVVLKP